VTPPPGNITVYRQPGTVAGTYQSRPQGIILHGSRSGQNWDTDREFDSCRQYAANGAGGLGWTATIGNLEYSCHMTPRQYGWNARSDSSRMLAVEFAQARLGDPITDRQVEAFVAWYNAEVVPVWGALDLSQDRSLPTHAELSTGAADGKSDCYPAHSEGAKDVRARIRARL
jgi:hypothetical protein